MPSRSTVVTLKGDEEEDVPKDAVDSAADVAAVADAAVAAKPSSTAF